MFDISPANVLTSKDLEDCSRLLASIPLLDLGEQTVEDFCKKLIARGELLLARQDETIMGLLGYYKNDTETKTAYLSVLSVEDIVMGTGLAQALVDAMIAGARYEGMSLVRLNVVKDNFRAIKFYQRNGFLLDGDGRDDNHYSMRKSV